LSALENILDVREGLNPEFRSPGDDLCATTEDVSWRWPLDALVIPRGRIIDLESTLFATPAGLLTLRPALIPYPAKPDGLPIFPLRLASGSLGDTRRDNTGVLAT
jgi:hypothetical protein